MTRWTRIALAGGAVVLAVVLFVVLRPGDDEEEPTPAAQATTEETTTAETTETETETEETTTEEAPTTTEAEDPNAPQRIVVVVRDGQPVGGVKRVEVEEGERVVFIVRSDVVDHVHFHGYEFLADVGPGQPVRMSFRADMPGQFDVELEDRAVPIAEFEVR